MCILCVCVCMCRFVNMQGMYVTTRQNHHPEMKIIVGRQGSPPISKDETMAQNLLDTVAIPIAEELIGHFLVLKW